ncbi:MAG: VanZ family protein [Candidatus Omnitrophota bacterium]|jgi:VanZ family protein
MPARAINKTRLLNLWLPVLLCMVAIFYFSSLPGRDIPRLFPLQDVLFHISLYALLAYFLARALRNTYSKLTLLKTVSLAVFFGTLYGISDEFHQLFVPERCFSAFDLFTDGIGSFIGSLLYR